MASDLSERFWSKVEMGPGCWRWTAALAPTGYGMIGRGPRQGTAYAHRLCWELTVGPIPAGLYVLHRCDNRWCVNPDHLFLGTHRDNIDDMVAKGRAPGFRGQHSAASRAKTSASLRAAYAEGRRVPRGH